MDADAVAMNTPGRLAIGFLTRPAAHIPQDEWWRREKSLRPRPRGRNLLEGAGRRLGGLFGGGFEMVWLSCSIQLSSAVRVPGFRSRSLCSSSKFGSSLRGSS